MSVSVLAIRRWRRLCYTLHGARYTSLAQVETCDALCHDVAADELDRSRGLARRSATSARRPLIFPWQHRSDEREAHAVLTHNATSLVGERPRGTDYNFEPCVSVVA